jgi:hypothetical protein
VGYPGLGVRSCRNATTWLGVPTELYYLSLFNDDACAKAVLSCIVKGESTQFPGLVGTKLRNAVAYKLHNVCCWFKAKHQSFYWMETRKLFYIPPVSVVWQHTTSRPEHSPLLSSFVVLNSQICFIVLTQTDPTSWVYSLLHFLAAEAFIQYIAWHTIWLVLYHV